MIKMNNPHIYKRIFKEIRPYTLYVILSVLLGAAGVAASLYSPILIGRAVDFIVGEGNVNFTEIGKLFITVGIMIAVFSVSQWLMTIINNKISYGVVKSVRRQAFDKIQKMPISYLDSHSSGDTVSRIINDSEAFGDGLIIGFGQLFTGILTIVGTFFFMVYIDYRITLFVVLITPLSLFVAKYISSKTYSMFKQRSEIRAEQTSFINEMVGNQKVVQAYTHEDENEEKFYEISKRLEKSSLKAIFYSSITNPVTRFINSVCYAGVALIGAFAVIGGDGALTVGMLFSLLSYAGQYAKPFNEITGVVTEFQNAYACAGRVFELVDQPGISDKTDTVPISNLKADIKFNNVEFSYTPDKPLIRNVNLDIKSGTRVAIVGPTGCGKTTLINLLMRFYDVTGGSITFDGTDIRDISRSELRHNIGMVLQDTWLSNKSVRDNIAMGRPGASDEEIKAAAKASHAHSFIKRLPDGYDTLVGEGGAPLSQGQKQLLCISRVMLAPPPILILDEATSSIDTRTEMLIRSAFMKLTEGRTSFVVAHRLSTIRNSDIILVMKDGNIIESGDHEELLKKGGFYKELYESQYKF